MENSYQYFIDRRGELIDKYEKEKAAEEGKVSRYLSDEDVENGEKYTDEESEAIDNIVDLDNGIEYNLSNLDHDFESVWNYDITDEIKGAVVLKLLEKGNKGLLIKLASLGLWLSKYDETLDEETIKKIEEGLRTEDKK